MAITGRFTLMMRAQVKNEYSAENALKNLDGLVRLIDVNASFDYSKFGKMMLIMNWTGNMSGLENFQSWLTRTRHLISTYFVVAQFKFSMTLKEAMEA